MLRQNDLKEFKKLYSEKFGIKLDNDTARLKLSILLRQVELTHNPPKHSSRKSGQKNEK